MSLHVAAADAAFDELVRTGQACESERTTFLFGFSAGIHWATYMLAKRTGAPIPTPKQLVSQLQLEKQS